MTPEEIAKYLESLGADKVKIGMHEITACCPIHNERRPSFGVALKTGHPYNCFACHAKGLLPGVAMEVKGMTWKEAYRYINRFGEYSLEDTLFYQTDDALFENRFDSVSGSLSLDYLDLFHDANLRMQAYLKRKGVPVSVMRRAGLRRLSGRIIFPWYEGHTLLGFTSRSYRDKIDSLRGCALMEFKKHQQIYVAKGSQDKTRCHRVHVVEGEIDALRLEALGYPAVALSGTTPTENQAKKLCGYADQIVAVFDNDKEGKEAENALVELLHHRVVVLRPTVLTGQYSDPGRLTKSLADSMLHDDNLDVCF